MHASETADERRHLRRAMYETQALIDASTDNEQRLDLSKKMVNLAQRYRLYGGDRQHWLEGSKD